MAANVAVTYTYVNGTAADGTQVNQNFADIVNWVNTNAVHLDGSKAFTGAPSYAADPVSANQLCRKSYVDGLASRLAARLRRVAASPSIADSGTYDIIWDTEDEDTNNFGAAGSTITFSTAGIYHISAVGFTSSNGKGSAALVTLTGTVTQMGSTSSLYEISAGATMKVTFTNATGFGATTLTACSIYMCRVSV